MALFDWYSYGQEKAVAGMKADSTVDVVDSYASEGAIAVGKAVELGTDPAKQVKASVTAANVIGISIFEQKVDTSIRLYNADDHEVKSTSATAVPVAANKQTNLKIN